MLDLLHSDLFSGCLEMLLSKYASLETPVLGNPWFKRRARLPDATAGADDDEVSRERLIILTLHPPKSVSHAV